MAGALVPAFVSLIAWFEAITFIKLYGVHSLMKHLAASSSYLNIPMNSVSFPTCQGACQEYAHFS